MVEFDHVNYAEWIRSIKERVVAARLRALMVANTELLLLYWDIGKEILDKQAEFGWGAKIVSKVAEDLQQAFPEVKGFSRSNLMYMRAFAAAWTRREIVQAPLGQLPWYHHIALLSSLESKGDRVIYAKLAVENGWSRNVLVHHIEAGSAQLENRAIANFKATLPASDSDLAAQTFKDSYNLSFLGVSLNAHENTVRAKLVDQVAKFLMELGSGFSYVGKGITMDVGGEPFELDLLFYHVLLHRYVVIELKTRKFKPQDLGQLSFYMSAIDRQVAKKGVDGKTIGLLLCKGKNDLVVQYALADMRRPMGVSTYNLGLPPEAEMQKQLETKFSQIC